MTLNKQSLFLPNRKIFRGYDIRGVYPNDLNEETTGLIGKAIGSFYIRNGVKEVIVGRDNRLSSESLQKALISGLTSTGCNVADIGLALTPMVYFSTWVAGFEGAVNVTASHNPAKYNGLKVVFDKSIIVGVDVLKLIDEDNFATGAGKIRNLSIENEYLANLSSKLKFAKSLKIGFDPGNGTSTSFAQKLYRQLGFEVFEIHAESDGNYPNHPPDPQLVENYGDLAQLIKDNNLDLGIMLDGDADRFNFCDDEGIFGDGDIATAIFAKDILKDNPGGKIMVNALVSQGILDFIKNSGGEPFIWKVGHAYLKNKMVQDSKIIFCGETGSGHMFFADRYFGVDDALYASLRLCEIVSNSQKPLSALVSEIRAQIPKYFATPEVRISCPDEIKFELVEDVKSQLKKNFEVTDIDGVRFATNGGWGIIRPSNTEPVLSIRAEGKTVANLEEIKKIISEVLSKFKPQVNLVWD